MSVHEPPPAGPARAIRASVLHCLESPRPGAEDEALQYFDDGVLLLRNGRIAAVGPAATLLAQIGPEVSVDDRRGYLLVPGFIDTHVHYPQIDIMASHGQQLLDWLNQYAWPAETRFDDPEVCADTADFFLEQLLCNGTTTACVFGTVHAQSVDAFMSAAARRKLRMIAGKVLMDTNCPAALLEPTEVGIENSAQLIERWHGKERLSYALTPRFAPTSSPQLLAATGQLLQSRAGLYLQTHMAETRAETSWVAELFPQAPSYLGVYQHYGLVGERSIFAHCIHIDDNDRARMAEAGAAIAFCPTSNLFLGSGLFDHDAARRAGVSVGLGSDIGAGTRFGLLETVAEAYKAGRLRGKGLHPFEGFYLATLGGARALNLHRAIGNFETGKEADFVLLDYNATPLLARRIAAATSLEERLFALMMLADDRAIAATYVLGEKVHERN